MKKKLLLFTVLASLMVLAACESDIPEIVDDPIVISDSIPEDEIKPEPPVSDNDTVVDVSENDPEPAAVEKAPSAFKAIRMYADYLDAMCESREDLTATLHYDLLYVDDDDIPELAYMEHSAHVATVHLCMAYDDGVYEVGEFGEYGNFAYIPGTGKILSFQMNQGVYLYDFFHLENRTLQEDTSFEIVEGQLEGEITRYYIDGDEVEEEAYNTAFLAAKETNYSSCDYFDAFSYADSYDVYSILMQYHKLGHRPPTIEITNEILNATGEYSADKFGVYGAEPKPIGDFEGMFASLTLSEDGFLSVWYGDGTDEGLVTDYAMPLNGFKTGIGTLSEGSEWYVTASNEDKTRNYEMHYMPDKTVKLIVFDSNGFKGDFSYYFEMSLMEEPEVESED